MHLYSDFRSEDRYTGACVVTGGLSEFEQIGFKWRLKVRMFWQVERQWVGSSR